MNEKCFKIVSQKLLDVFERDLYGEIDKCDLRQIIKWVSRDLIIPRPYIIIVYRHMIRYNILKKN
jgi:hypothetical protein